MVTRRSNSDEDNPKSKLQTRVERTIGTLVLGPIVFGIIVGVFTVLVKFIQICIAWVS